METSEKDDGDSWMHAAETENFPCADSDALERPMLTRGAAFKRSKFNGGTTSVVACTTLGASYSIDVIASILIEGVRKIGNRK